ncbi:YbaN family protein [Pontixanthobacter sp.]|uniref:YbaN family protein n=1 Tax=Pontixanthobacter sp. TaxID=2792078 RepID=UPI003C7B249F
MRPVYLAIGILAAICGAIGAVLPLVPTVPFLILAAFCFAKSNPAWEQKLLDHPHWGPQLRDWRDRRAVSRKSKFMAVGAMGLGAIFTYFTLGLPWAYGSVAILVTCGAWIITRNE